MRLQSFARGVLVVACFIQATTAAAADCGRSFAHSQVEKLVKAIEAANTNISQHRVLLLHELRAMLERGSGGNGELNFRKVAAEEVLLSSASISTTYTLATLERAQLLLQLRNLMVDQKDMTTIERHLSIVAAGVGDQSRMSKTAINQLLALESRPDIATDMAKLRDSVSDVVAVFEKCTMPEGR